MKSFGLLLLLADALLACYALPKLFDCLQGPDEYGNCVVEHKTLSLEELNQKLGLVLKRSVNLPNVKIDGEHVEEFLAAAKDKSKPRSILNKYSVDELLALNKYYYSDCGQEQKLEKHRRMCTELDPKQIAERGGLTDYDIHKLTRRSFRTKTPSEYMRYKNLYDYCESRYNSFMSWCTRRSLEKTIRKLKGKPRERLIQSMNEAREFVTTRYENASGQIDLEAALRKFLGTKNESSIESLKENCKRLMGAVVSVRVDPDYAPEWCSELDYYCDIVSSTSELSPKPTSPTE